MRHTRVISVAMLLTATMPAGASVLCAKKSGVVVVRPACRKRETALNPSSFGAVGTPGPRGPAGPQGNQGPPGAQGAQGMQGPAGVSGYEVVSNPASVSLDPNFGTFVSVNCSSGKKALGGGCDSDYTGLDAIWTSPSSDGSGWNCFMSNSSASHVDTTIRAWAACAVIAP